MYEIFFHVLHKSTKSWHVLIKPLHVLHLPTEMYYLFLYAPHESTKNGMLYCVFLYALHKSTKNILYLYELCLCPICVPKDTHMFFMSYINQQKSWHVLKAY